MPQLAVILVSVSTPEQAQDDKQSLQTQERDLRAIAVDRGWKVLDVLRIPGFSRDYISWEECAQDMLKQGITALADLKRYADAKAFDVFMVRDADRFGRTQSLIMQIAETICIRQRLKIYSQIDNTLVEGEAARFWAAMTGLRSAGEMDKKKIYHHNGMEKRAELGFHEGRTPWFHRTIHDPDTGKPLHVELREEYRYIWDAVYDLLVVERVGFNSVEWKLVEQHKIVNPQTGQKFNPLTFYTTLSTRPAAWGHRMRGEHTYERQHGRGLPYGEWVYNPTVPPPEGIKMFYNVFPPIYTGKQAEAIQAELRRRMDIHGGSKPDNLPAFSGLVICDYCEHHMTHIYNANTDWRAFRCTSYMRRNVIGRGCESRRRSIHYKTLVAWMDSFLTKLIAGHPLVEAFPTDEQPVEAEISSLEDQLEKGKRESARLVERLGLIPDSMLPDYQRKMQNLANRAATMNSRLQELQKQHRAQDRRAQDAALQDINRIGLETFWNLPEAQQHQLLKRLFGDWRIVVADGEVVAVARAGRRRGGHAIP